MNDHFSRAQPVAFRSFTPAEVEELATVCLSSPDSDARMRAQDELRPLCHFEQWDRMKDLFLGTENQYAIFVLVKATLHIVINEVVPHERVAIMAFINGYCAGNPTLSDASIAMLLRVSATCIFLNWRSMILTFDGPRLADLLQAAQMDTPLGQVIADEAATASEPVMQHDADTDLGLKVMQDLDASLQGVSHLMIAVGIEIVQHFTAELKSGTQTRLLHESFVAFLLPRFFALAIEHLDSEVHLEASLRLCVACLEVPPADSLRGMIERYTTDEIIRLAPMEKWFEMLVRALTRVSQRLDSLFQGNAFSANDDATEVETCLHLTSLISQVSFDDVPPPLRMNVVGALVCLGMKCLMNFPNFQGMESFCHHGSSVITNVMERHAMEAMNVFESESTHVKSLASLVGMISMDWDLADDQAKGSLLTVVALILQDVSGPTLNPDSTAETSQAIFAILSHAFEAYLHAVIAHCHLSEGDDDIHCPEALELHNETLLRPVSVVMQSCESHFSRLIDQVLSESIASHDIAVRIKQGFTVSPEESLQVMQLLITVALDEVNEESFALVVTRVALSRISVVINIISLWLKARNRGHLLLEESMDDFNLLSRVMTFAKNFLTEDISDLLMCMDVSGMKKPANGRATLHVGVLRSLLYFASAVATSGFAEQPQFIASATNIMHFVLTRHSLEAPVLAADSVELLQTFWGGDDGNQSFTGSQHFINLMAAHFNGDIDLTARAGVIAAASSQGNSMSAGGRLLSLRKHLFRAMAGLLDRRYMLGQAGDRQEFYSLLDTISAPLLDMELRNQVGTVAVVEIFLSDVRGVAKVVTAPLLLQSLMQWIMNQKSILVDCLSAHTCLSLSATKTWSKLARRFRDQLTEDLSSPLPPTFCSFVFDSVDFLLLQRLAEHGPFYELSVAEQGAIAVLLNSVLRGTWCNVAVMIFYGDLNIPRVLLSALRKFISSPPAEVMSLKNRAAFFHTIGAAFDVKEATLAVRQATDYVKLCEDLSLFLVACLRVCVTVELLEAINVVFAPGSVPLLYEKAVVDVFRELSIILSTNAAPQGEDGIPVVCYVLHRLYRAFPTRTSEVLETLLTQASAWHRVRLRCLLLMLHNDPVDLASQFLNTFGAASTREQIISAW